jgi:hypothetical protein
MLHHVYVLRSANNSKFYSRIKMISNGVKIVILLFLLMTTLFMMPRNVWGEEIYMYTDKEGTIVITNTPPQENINSNIRKGSNSYQESTPEERLHWGRDNALIDEQWKGRNGQRKKVKADGGIEAGRHKVKIKKIGNYFYQDTYTRIIIKTQACVELAGRDESLLDWSGVSGELYFKNTNKSCIVKKVYK